jgi:hypothetical protein
MSIGPLKPDRVRLRSGAEIGCVAFYSPGTGLTPCDVRTGGAPFANFWPLAPAHIVVTHNGASGRFANSEAAYQSLKWWQHTPTRRRFEACDASGLDGGEAAFHLKRALEKDASLEEFQATDCDGLNKWGAMLLVLRAKCAATASAGRAHALATQPLVRRQRHAQPHSSTPTAQMAAATLP